MLYFVIYVDFILMLSLFNLYYFCFNEYSLDSVDFEEIICILFISILLLTPIITLKRPPPPPPNNGKKPPARPNEPDLISNFQYHPVDLQPGGKWTSITIHLFDTIFKYSLCTIPNIVIWINAAEYVAAPNISNNRWDYIPHYSNLGNKQFSSIVSQYDVFSITFMIIVY